MEATITTATTIVHRQATIHHQIVIIKTNRHRRRASWM
jgi:hypothetical protein